MTDPLDMSDYDWRKDSYESWLLALKEIRKRKIAAGELQPTEEELREAKQ